MNLQDKLEILIPTFNRKKLLEKTLEQLLDQDSPVKDLQITILDNACTDGTPEMLAKFMNRHKNIKHVRNNIRGCPR